MTDDDTGAPDLQGHDRDLDALCEAWVWWCREHRLYGRMINLSEFGRLPDGRRAPLMRPEHPVDASAMTALHIAYTCQPSGIDKHVFELFHVVRLRPVKSAANYLGIGPRQFYRVLSDFRRRLDVAAQSFLVNNGDLQVTPKHGAVLSVNSESVPPTRHNVTP